MLPLILFVCLGIAILVIFEVRARKEQKSNSEQTTGVADLPSTASDLQQSDLSSSVDDDSGCCGEHLVCERETLLQTNAKVEYYDDEELDTLSGIPAEKNNKHSKERQRPRAKMIYIFRRSTTMSNASSRMSNGN